jgi:hypothetical protein
MARMEGLDLLAAAVVVRVVPQVQGITHPAQLAEQRLRVAVPAVMRRLVLVVIRVVEVSAGKWVKCSPADQGWMRAMQIGAAGDLVNAEPADKTA